MVRERVLQRFGIGRPVRERPEAARASGEHAQFAARRHDRSEQNNARQTDVREHATSQKVQSLSAERMTGDLDHRQWRRAGCRSRRLLPQHVQVKIS